MLRYWIIDIIGSLVLYFLIGLAIYHFWWKDKDVDKKSEKDYAEQRQEKTYNRDSFEHKHKDSFYFEKEK